MRPCERCVTRGIETSCADAQVGGKGLRSSGGTAHVEAGAGNQNLRLLTDNITVHGTLSRISLLLAYYRTSRLCRRECSRARHVEYPQAEPHRENQHDSRPVDCTCMLVLVMLSGRQCNRCEHDCIPGNALRTVQRSVRPFPTQSTLR